jgi:hypothetical protein
MSAQPARGNEMRIVLQVGSSLRIKNNGDIIVDNPELELARDTQAADAVLLYHLDDRTGEHILRLVEPVAIRLQGRSERRK